jgi:hypothetical protein
MRQDALHISLRHPDLLMARKGSVYYYCSIEAQGAHARVAPSLVSAWRTFDYNLIKYKDARTSIVDLFHPTLIIIISLFVKMRPSIALALSTLVAATAGTSCENRTLDEIYQAALKEGDVVTLWHGGDEKNQQDGLKKAFEERFPGITLNVTVDLSKYHDGRLDDQLSKDNVYVDSIILQTLHDYPRWKKQGALLNYKPGNFASIASDFKDPEGAYYGYAIFGWSTTWNTAKYNGSLADFADALLPELKDKLILTYPNDDDAVLYAFDLV